MYYISKILLKTKKSVSSIELTSGLNIIYGISNTGKSLILECIDYLCGGDSEKLEDEALGIEEIEFEIETKTETDSGQLILKRKTGKSDIEVDSTSPNIQSGTYGAKSDSKNKPIIGKVWLALMGIVEPVTIYQFKSGSVQNLKLRTFIHAFLINEDRMIDSLSILKNNNGWTNNIPVSTITSLIYLATEKNFMAEEDTGKQKNAIIEQRKYASQRLVDRSLLALSQKHYEIISAEKEVKSVSELEKEINTILAQISAAEESLNVASNKNRELSSKIVYIDEQLSEGKSLKNRYDALRTQYESDIHRLTFIAEGDVHSRKIIKLDRCPFCNGELNESTSESCVDAAVAEVQKIELKINDLQSAYEDIEREIASLEVERKTTISERQKTQSVIRGELKPQIEDLRNKLRQFTIAMERAKTQEMIESMGKILQEEQKRADAEDDSALSSGFDVEGKIKEYLSDKFDDHLNKILIACNYEHFVGARFDIESCDAVVNGRKKAAQGKGIKAFINAVMALTVQETLEEYNCHKIGLLVLDSPIMSLKEKKREIPESEVAPMTMKEALFSYLVETRNVRQTIILENDIPDIDYLDSNLIQFTKDENNGRYGLLIDYRE